MCFGKVLKVVCLEVFFVCNGLCYTAQCVIQSRFQLPCTILCASKLHFFEHFPRILCRIMNIFQRFVYTLNRPIAWKRSSHERTDQWKAIRIGDVVEAAVENPSDIRYRVEEIFAEEQKARVVRLGAKNEELERYTLGLIMLRPLAKATVK